MTIITYLIVCATCFAAGFAVAMNIANAALEDEIDKLERIKRWW